MTVSLLAVRVMWDTLFVTRVLLGLVLLAFCAYSGLSVWAARRWRRAHPATPADFTPAVTIFKPVRGYDPEAWENFVSYCQLDYPTDRLQIIFGALDTNDPALTLARRLQTEYPHIDIEVVAGEAYAELGYNRKVCNLIAMRPHARYDLLVLCDSDTRVRPDYLRRVVAPFQDAKVGLVTCAYRGYHARSLASRLEALGIGAEFIPSALVSAATEGVAFAFGSTMLLTARVLDELGGFESLRNELADDFRLGNGARQLGYDVVLSDYVIDDVLGEERFAAMWARRLRWGRTVRVCRPTGYAGSFVTYGTVWSGLLLLASGLAWWGWATLWGILVVRWLCALIVGSLTDDPNPRRYWWLLPVSDVLSFVLYALSWCGSTIVWRGERFRLRRDGQMEVIRNVVRSPKTTASVNAK